MKQAEDCFVPKFGKKPGLVEKQALDLRPRLVEKLRCA